jgi:hypothetical protein
VKISWCEPRTYARRILIELVIGVVAVLMIDLIIELGLNELVVFGSTNLTSRVLHKIGRMNIKMKIQLGE